MSKSIDDTDKIQLSHVCMEHSGVCQNMKNVVKDVDNLWRAVGQMICTQQLHLES